MLVADDDQASFWISLKNIGKKCASRGFGGVRINDVDLGARRLEIAEIRSESGFQLLGDHFELGLGQ